MCDKNNMAVFPADLVRIYIMFNTSDYTVITNDKIKEFYSLSTLQMSDLLDFYGTFEKEFMEGLDNA